MTLIIEDGTSKANAESYLSVADFKGYCDARGLSYAGQADTAIEQKLRIATGYIDTVKRYKGSRLTTAQALEFPRDGLTDWGGLEVTGVPGRVKQACAELAFKAFTENLYVDLDRGGMVTSQSVGPISVSYADGAPAGKSFMVAMKLLEPYFRDPKDVGKPFFVPVDPYFQLTTHDNPETETEFN
jgi:hypothetical protein